MNQQAPVQKPRTEAKPASKLWRDMPEAPRDGTHLLLNFDDPKLDGEWHWYKTRKWSRKSGCWESLGFWTQVFKARSAPMKPPVGWRHINEGWPA